MLLAVVLLLAVALLLSLIRLLLAMLLVTIEFRKRLFAFGKEHFCLCRREEERGHNMWEYGVWAQEESPCFQLSPFSSLAKLRHKLDMSEVQSSSSYMYSGLILAPPKHSRFSTTIFLYPDSPKRYCTRDLGSLSHHDQDYLPSHGTDLFGSNLPTLSLLQDLCHC